MAVMWECVTQCAIRIPSANLSDTVMHKSGSVVGCAETTFLLSGLPCRSSKAHSTEEIKRELQEIKAALKNKRRSSTGAHADVSSTSPPAYNTDYNSTNPYAWMDKMYGDTQQVIPPPPQGYLGMNRTAHQASDSDAAGTSSVPKAEASTTATTSAADSATADAAASGSSAQVERTVPADPPGGPVPYPPSFMEVGALNLTRPHTQHNATRQHT